jgi:hypothetical protein
VNAVRRHLKPEGLKRGSGMFDRLDKRRIVVASARLVHALSSAERSPNGLSRNHLRKSKMFTLRSLDRGVCFVDISES